MQDGMYCNLGIGIPTLASEYNMKKCRAHSEPIANIVMQATIFLPVSISNCRVKMGCWVL